MFLRNCKQFAKQLISYLRRVISSHKISDRDVCQYFRKSIIKLMYSNYHHAVIRRRLLPKGNKVLIQHNFFKYKSISKENAIRWKRKHRELAMSWSKRVVLYMKRQRAIKKLENREKAETILQPEELQKLNERIRQYKNSAALELEIVEDTLISDCLNKSATDALKFDDSPGQPDFLDNHNVNSTEKQVGPVKGSKFLDSLINKLTKDSQGASPSISVMQRKTPLNQPRKDVVHTIHSGEKILKVRNDDSESSNSSDFFGFTESDLATGLLPTPLVPKQMQSDKSAFVSECLDAFLRENSLENRTTIEMPKVKRIEEGMVCEGAQPPRIQMQKVPDEFGKARTVAQKRMMMESKKGVKFLIIENENSVYRELMKRSKTGNCNQNLIAVLQDSNIPFTRDCWKATSWLLTSNGRFCFQIISANGKNYKLVGSRGNHLKKVLGGCSNISPRRRRKIGCPPNCKQPSKLPGVRFQVPARETGTRVAAQNDENIAKNLKRKGPSIMDPIRDSKRYKPCPLSKKRYKYSDHSDAEVFEMPSLQLEVFPHVNQPLDDRIKPYLKLILPSENISREWAEFAVSTLVLANSEHQMEDVNKKRKSFTFNLPYVNNKKTVLVRKILKRNEKFDESLLGASLGFGTNINPMDDVQVVCGNILTEMIDSVALSLSEDSLIKSDPGTKLTLDGSNDGRNVRDIGNVQEAENEKASKIETSQNKPQKRLLSELKRLNATIVEAQDDIIREINKCTEDHCKYGCVCQSLSLGKGVNVHCNKPTCMFECTCRNGQTTETYAPNGLLSKEDALIIREKVTARLAKVEKEFCSTVVLTDNQTYLLNDSQAEKRRTKRVPKRFTDFIHEELPSSTNKGGSDEIALDKAAYIAREDDSDGKLLHCNVSLRKLEILHDLEPWCMVHCLYKCYCKGEAVKGEPFKFEQKDAIEIEEVVRPQKPLLSCGKEELQKSVPYNAVKRKYYASGYVRGSRTSAIPSNMYKKLNRGKIKELRTEAEKSDTSEKQHLLKLRITNCSANKLPKVVPDSKQKQGTVTKKRRSSPFEGEIVIGERKKLSSERFASTPITCLSTETAVQTNSKTLSPFVNNLAQNETVSRNKLKASTSHDILAQETNKSIQLMDGKIRESLLADRSRSDDNMETELETDENAFTNEEEASLLDARNENPTGLPLKKPRVDNEAVVTPRGFRKIAPKLQGKIPVISSVVSLNAEKFDKCSTTDTKNHLVKFLGTNTQDIHNTALTNLNIAVTRTMQGITNIQMQSKGAKDIPNARPATLFNLRWDNFLKGFNEGSLFVWEVCVRNHNILVATAQNIMPQIPGAMCVANIKVLAYNRLPLLGKMLRDRCCSHKMRNLFVLLAGQNGYWSVIGMINKENKGLELKGVVKPTPISHPEVSAKVNFLYQQQVLLDLEKRKKQHRTHHSNAGHVSKAIAQNKPNYKPVLSSRSPEKPLTRNPKLGSPVFSSNLKIRPMTKADALTVNLPIPIEKDHMWFIMDLKDDFSHIFVPEWKDFLTYDRIKKSLAIAMKEMKTVRMGNLSSFVDVYVTPDSCHRLYVGPFYSKNPVNFVLCRYVNGKIITREDFEKNHKTHRMGNTMAYWLTIKSSKFIYENTYDGCTVSNLTDDSKAVNKRNCTLSATQISPSGQSSKSEQSSNSPQQTKTTSNKLCTSNATCILNPNQKSDKIQSFAGNKGEFKQLTSGMTELNSVPIRSLAPLKYLNAQEEKLLRKQQPKQSMDASKLKPPTRSSNSDGRLSLLKAQGWKEMVNKISSHAAENIAGHFVNDETPSFKIPAEKRPTLFVLKFANPTHFRAFQNEERVNLYLSRITKAGNSKWRFVPIKNPCDHNYYAMQNPSTSTNEKKVDAVVSLQNSSSHLLPANGQATKKVEQVKSKTSLDCLLARRSTESDTSSASKIFRGKEQVSVTTDFEPNASTEKIADVILIED